MAQEKILELGLEGRGATFLKDEEKIIITKTANDLETGDVNIRQNTFNSFREAIEAFVKSNPPLLFFFPIYVNSTYTTPLLAHLYKEIVDMNEQQRKEMFNKEEWERKLNSSISSVEDSDNPLIQWFEITPLEKVETYCYDHYGDERVLDQIKTAYVEHPNQKFRKQGIGEIKNNTFVIRDEDEKLVGVYPVEQYWVKVLE